MNGLQVTILIVGCAICALGGALLLYLVLDYLATMGVIAR